MKILTVFNDTIRKDTTGIYIDKALKELGHEVVHIPSFEDHCGVYDECIVVDDGMIKDIPIQNYIYWVIDSHIENSFIRNLNNCINAKKVYTAQKNSVERIINYTGKQTEWLPLAGDTEIWHNFGVATEKKYDVCFIGTARPDLEIFKQRIEYLDTLFKAVDKFYYGMEFFNKAAKIYSQSKIVFNYSINQDINMRIFESMLSGSLLFTNKIDNGLEDLGFIDGKNIVLYDTKEDMLNKINTYINNEDLRNKIAIEGKDLIMEKHLYTHRIKKILE